MASRFKERVTMWLWLRLLTQQCQSRCENNLQFRDKLRLHSQLLSQLMDWWGKYPSSDKGIGHWSTDGNWKIGGLAFPKQRRPIIDTRWLWHWEMLHRKLETGLQIGGGRFPPPLSPSTTPDGTLWWIAAACTLPHCTFGATLQRMSTAESHFPLSLQSPVTMSPPMVSPLRANIKIFSFSNPLGSTGTQALSTPSVLIKLKSCCTQDTGAHTGTHNDISHGVCLQIDCVFTQPSLWSESSQKFGFVGIPIHRFFSAWPARFYGKGSNLLNMVRILWNRFMQLWNPYSN